MTAPRQPEYEWHLPTVDYPTTRLARLLLDAHSRLRGLAEYDRCPPFPLGVATGRVLGLAWAYADAHGLAARHRLSEPGTHDHLIATMIRLAESEITATTERTAP